MRCRGSATSPRALGVLSIEDQIRLAVDRTLRPAS
jgi:hypothetical protein